MRYWFYAKVKFLKIESPSEVYYLLAVDIQAFEHTYQPEFNRLAPGFSSCVGAFTTASRSCGSRDLVEEFVAAKIWPLSPGWYPFELKKVKFSYFTCEIDCPIFGLNKPEGLSDHTIVSEVERDACNLLGPWN